MNDLVLDWIDSPVFTTPPETTGRHGRMAFTKSNRKGIGNYRRICVFSNFKRRFEARESEMEFRLDKDKKMNAGYANDPRLSPDTAPVRDGNAQRDPRMTSGISSPAGAIQRHFRSLSSNMPALVYQQVLYQDGTISFPFLSDGCQSLLGIPAERLGTNPAAFTQMIHMEDRAAYQASMTASARDLSSWNWEGRVWIEAWRDTKWINLRAMPHRRPEGGVQWDGLMTNITRGKLSQLEIMRSRQQLAELTAHINQVRELERTRIARDIHDELGGNLSSMKMALAQLVRHLPPGPAPLLEKARYLDVLIDRTIDSAHRISANLRPAILDLGIVAAVRWQAREFGEQMKITCNVIAAEEDLDLPADFATVLFRIFQEALTNIARHAGAATVTAELARDKGFVTLEVVDDGKGLAKADLLKPNAFGLRGMEERAASLGGTLSIDTGIAGGCQVRVQLPI